jgi:SAM-dependent methyltransferase
VTSAARAASSRYATVAPAYRDHWAPVLAGLARPAIEAILAALGLDEMNAAPDAASVALAPVVVDLGCGPGEIARIFVSHGARAVGVDPTFEMLAAAPFAFSRVAGDAVCAPLRDGCADAVVSTFALQHMPYPGRAFSEAARMLKPGGVLATATWGTDHDETGAREEVVPRLLARLRAPVPPPMKTWHAKVDAPPKLRRYARAAGFGEIRAASERASHAFTPESFLAWTTASGANGRRLALLDAAARRAVIDDARAELETLPAAEFAWRPEIVVCIATR